MGPAAQSSRRERPEPARARETFIDTYAAVNTAQDMKLHLERSYAPALQRDEIENVSMLTIVAEDDGRLTGFAQGRYSTAPPCLGALATPPRRPWEILRFYVQRDWHGRGLARALMDSARAGAGAAGADAVWLSVWKRNERAQTFYRKCGFHPIGETTFTLGEDVQQDYVMLWLS